MSRACAPSHGRVDVASTAGRPRMRPSPLHDQRRATLSASTAVAAAWPTSPKCAAGYPAERPAGLAGGQARVYRGRRTWSPRSPSKGPARPWPEAPWQPRRPPPPREPGPGVIVHRSRSLRPVTVAAVRVRRASSSWGDTRPAAEITAASRDWPSHDLARRQALRPQAAAERGVLAADGVHDLARPRRRLRRHAAR